MKAWVKARARAARRELRNRLQLKIRCTNQGFGNHFDDTQFYIYEKFGAQIGAVIAGELMARLQTAAASNENQYVNADIAIHPREHHITTPDHWPDNL